MATPINPERLINELPSIASPRISPDGSQIAYVRRTVNVESGKDETAIWLAGIDGSNRRQLTFASARNGNPAWSPDGSSLAFVTSRDDRTALAILDLAAGGEARIVTTQDQAISGIAWSPDGGSIAFASPVDPENPNEPRRDPKAPAAVRVVKRIDYKQDGLGYLNDVRNQIFVVDVTSGTTSGEKRQLTHDTIDHVGPAWSPDGSKLAISLPHHNTLLAGLGIIDVASAGFTRFGPDNAAIGNIRWTPDGAGILHTEGFNIQPSQAWFLYDVASGEAKQLTEEIEFSAGGEESGTPWLDATHAAFLGGSRGRTGVWTIDIASGEITEIAIWNWLGRQADFNAGTETAVIAMTGLDGVVGLTRIDLATGAETLLFNEATGFFSEFKPSQWELVTIERNGYTIEGWLHKPADFDESKKYPVVLDVHGGPHGFYGYTLDELTETLATNDILVIKSNPRGSGSYGPAFGKAVIGDWGGEDWKDLQGILDKVLERPYADAERTGIYGYSYGGYMTSWAIGQTTRFKAAVCGAPCYDFESFFGTSDVGHIFGSQGYKQLPWENTAITLERSPSSHIQNATTPTLVIHGEA
ncbi:MAG TPA: prolyl oligopeptidase family serine peptidase, partial [Thermomicrobiales bacterium]|nr:prolyl oligopeptidase family serine peptidase [Thermomicrobiales bacterium]